MNYCIDTKDALVLLPRLLFSFYIGLGGKEKSGLGSETITYKDA